MLLAEIAEYPLPLIARIILNAWKKRIKLHVLVDGGRLRGPYLVNVVDVETVQIGKYDTLRIHVPVGPGWFEIDSGDDDILELEAQKNGSLVIQHADGSPLSFDV